MATIRNFFKYISVYRGASEAEFADELDLSADALADRFQRGNVLSQLGMRLYAWCINLASPIFSDIKTGAPRKIRFGSFLGG